MDERLKICQALGFEDISQVHRLIMEGVHKGGQWLVSKKLNAEKLTALGYDLAGMRKIGYVDSALQKLGYPVHPAETKSPPPPETLPQVTQLEQNQRANLRQLVAQGLSANELRQRGYTVRHCRDAGIDARVLYRIGFDLHELVGEYSLPELKRIGFNPRELIHHYKGPELRNVGFSAQEMRCSGFSVRDLLNFGYNENQVIAAGYSTNELIREGLSRTTHDMTKLQY